MASVRAVITRVIPAALRTPKTRCILSSLLLITILTVAYFAALLSTVPGAYSGIQDTSHNHSKNRYQPKFIKWQYGYGHKTVLLWTELFSRRDWRFGLGASGFHRRKCSERRCLVTWERDKQPEADVVLFHARDIVGGAAGMPRSHPPQQTWVFANLESPPNTYTHSGGWFQPPDDDLSLFDGMFNLTMTYMTDSDIVTSYGRYTNRSKVDDLFEFAVANRSRLVLWYVSNCITRGAKERMKVAKELGRHIVVDMYGYCASADPCNRDGKCMARLKSQYKFYLAFENSRCKEYITEKFWTSLEQGMVPVVWGAEMEDYERLAPPNSFIHVDNFSSIEALADHLRYLDSNDSAYLRYHDWRRSFTTTVAPATDPWCRLCQLAHEGPKTFKSYNISDYWSSQKLCRGP